VLEIKQYVLEKFAVCILPLVFNMYFTLTRKSTGRLSDREKNSGSSPEVERVHVGYI